MSFTQSKGYFYLSKKRKRAPPHLLLKHQVENARVGAVPLRVDCSQVAALGHKNVELSELLDVGDGELDASLNLHEVAAVHGHHASTQLRENRSKRFSRPDGPVALWENIGLDRFSVSALWESWEAAACSLIESLKRLNPQTIL